MTHNSKDIRVTIHPASNDQISVRIARANDSIILDLGQVIELQQTLASIINTNFKKAISGLNQGRPSLRLYEEAKHLVETIEVAKNGTASLNLKKIKEVLKQTKLKDME